MQKQIIQLCINDTHLEAFHISTKYILICLKPWTHYMRGSALVHLAAPNFMSFILGAKKLGCPNILEMN